MFQNAYQNGIYFQLFDPKASQDKTKSLFKQQNVTGNNKVFDKQLKTYVFDFTNSNCKMVFPREDRKQLYLIQQFLNFQVYFYPGLPWGIELTISDLTKTKRRILLSPSSKTENKPFFVKFGCAHVQDGIWSNLTVDLYSFIAAFKGQTYRSLDCITMSGHFRLRRIFTTPEPPIAPSSSPSDQAPPLNLLPKSLYLPTDLQCSNCMISYEEGSLQMQMEMMEIQDQTEPSTKNRSNVMSRNQISTPKTNTAGTLRKKGYRNQHKFLANTGGPQTTKKRDTKEHKSNNKSRYTEKPQAQVSIQKKERKGKTVGKPDRNRQIETNQKILVEKQKGKETKNKLNPWRSSKKNENLTDASQLSETKPLGSRKMESAETTLFKTKNKLASKFNDSTNKQFGHRSDHCSDSEYVELSQKFSTLSEGRFFKHQLGSQQFEKQKQDPDEIEQNIEMQSNQMNESNRKYQDDGIKQLKNQPIDESINDSLDKIQRNLTKIKKQPQRLHPQMLNSYYGFGQKLVNQYMGECQRPYSPPLCQKQLTQQASQRNEEQQKQVEMIYDPVLNCYYDHKTHTYYELKN